METLLSISRLRKQYSPAFTMGPLDFAIQSGEILAILGPNGSGKTTCLKMIAGIMSGGSGQYSFNDPDLTPYKSHIGYMSEEISIWPDLRCCEQVKMLADIYSSSSEIGSELVKRLKLEEYIHHKGSSLSLGNQRKLSLVLSVVHDPALLILDEPFNGLDALGRRETSKWLRERVHSASSKGPKAVLLSSHQLEEIEKCADRVLIMKDGCIEYEYIPGRDKQGLSGVYHDLFDRETRI